MHSKLKIAFLFVFWTACWPVMAQEIPATTPDTIQLYRSIESYSRRTKFTQFIYRLIVDPEGAILPGLNRKGNYLQEAPLVYRNFEGARIRKIDIESVDPFHYTHTDTVIENKYPLARLANEAHIKTSRLAIRNLLLIRPNMVFDSLLVKESERLLRSQAYLRDVLFHVQCTSENSDSVDLLITVFDSWSLIPKLILSPSQQSFQLNERNLLGSGHAFKNRYSWFPGTDGHSLSSQYYVPNIRNTYVNVNIYYDRDPIGNFKKGISVNRRFYSPFTRWAAGASVDQQFELDSIGLNDSLYYRHSLKFYEQDYWVGNAMQIFRGRAETNRATNFISAIRFNRITYRERPPETIDTLKRYSDKNLYLATLGISTRKYIRDRYIFNFGLPEYVPVGKVFSITGGYENRLQSGRTYTGARISWGNYFTWGILSYHVEYGTFWRVNRAEQGLFYAGVNYFTRLIEIGTWKFRQFVKPQAMFGIRRNASERININNGYGIEGFNSATLTGTSRLLLTLQAQSYAPWSLIGFRFGPFLGFSAGMLGTEKSGFKKSTVYTQLGFGVLIKNDYLAINTFQISLSYYPIIPGNSQHVFILNAFKTTDLGFRDFEMGRPYTNTYE